MTERPRRSRKATHCKICKVKLDPHETVAKCDECKDQIARNAKRRYARRLRTKYWKNVKDARRKARKRYKDARKSGRCRCCPKPRLRGSAWCRHHRHLHRQASRASMFRLRVRRAYLYLSLLWWLYPPTEVARAA